ncbi:MAG: hypothetical protein NTU89_01700 [Candidatus Dependentiae bacterium]|nr:hypothetical protein [Candidatus Dependentiae bacterium]
MSFFSIEAYCSVGEKRLRDGARASRADSPVLVLEEKSPVLLPVGKIIGDYPLSRPKGVKVHDFYHAVLFNQEDKIIKSFCAQIQMAPSYWKTEVNNIKRELFWPSDKSSNSFWLVDEKEESVDGIQKYLSSRGCGVIPIIYEQPSESDDSSDNIIDFRGIFIHVYPEFFKLTYSEQCDHLDGGLVYFQNNHAFNVHVMHKKALEAHPYNQPALESIMKLYITFARRYSDLLCANNGSRELRLDDSSKVDYIAEFVKMRTEDASEVVEPWIDASENPGEEDISLSVLIEEQKGKEDFAVQDCGDGIGKVLWSHMDKDR